MNKQMQMILGVLACIAMLEGVVMAAPSQRLKGVVRERPEKNPLEGVSVIAMDPGEVVRASSLSESDGSYVLEKLPAGTKLTIEFRLVGYLDYPASESAVLDEGETRVLDVLLMDENPSDAKVTGLVVSLLTSEDRAAEIEWLSSLGLSPEVRSRIDIALNNEATSRGYFKDIYFDFDSFSLTPEARKSLAQSAELLRNFPVYVIIEGHDDGQRPNEYAMALAQRRATEVETELVARGVPASRLHVISYGEERPLCTEATETCLQSNRRAHFSLSLGR